MKQWALILGMLLPSIALLQGDSADRHSKVASSAEWLALQQSMDAIHSAMMSAAPSKDDDADFVRLMIPHHQAAIDMAKAQLLYGTDPQMRRLAQEIVTEQQSEIDLMQLWLKQRQSVPPTVKQ